MLVFDGTADAPLGGAYLRSFPGGRFIVVLDPEEGQTAAFEAALMLARAHALSTLIPDRDVIDEGWLVERCDELNLMIDEVRPIKLSLDAAARAIQRTRQAHDEYQAKIRGFAIDLRAPLTDPDV